MPKEVGSVPMHDPLAFFLTWTTYGSWLPGDERGWAAKPGRLMPADSKRVEAAKELMTESELTLSETQREIVEKTIADHCEIRRWHLHAVNCRTQHVHVVVSALNRDPEDVMDQFKAWCTRKLKDNDRAKGVTDLRQNWWTQRGSKRQLFDEASVEAAILYVLEGQGGPPIYKEPPLKPEAQAKVIAKSK